MSQTKREKKNICLQILGKIGTLTGYFKLTLLLKHVTLEWYMLVTINTYNNSNMAKETQLLLTQLAVNSGWPMSLGKVCDKYFKVRNKVNILKKKKICYVVFVLSVWVISLALLSSFQQNPTKFNLGTKMKVGKDERKK